MKRVTLNLIATNNYTEFLDDIIMSAKNHFMKDTDLSFIIYANSEKVKESKNISVIHVDDEPWPGPTLKRFHYFCLAEELIKESDFSFYVDVDSLFRKDLSLSDLYGMVTEENIKMIGTLHPGFYGTEGTPERRPISTAYIPLDSKNQYFCGGFFGGKSSDFLEMSKNLMNNIESDLKKNLIAVWHDESHLNKYFFNFPPSLILGTGFSCPEERLGDYLFKDPTLIFLDKGEEKNDLRKISGIRNLLDCTFIIPIKVEHDDRYKNAKSVLSYLNKNFKTNVFIYEVSEFESKLDFLPSLKNLKIKHWLDKTGDVFHRTRYLNVMLDDVKTKVVANYDIDVLLKPRDYIKAVSKILKGESDVVYPYKFGPNGQRRIQKTPNIHSIFASEEYNLESIDKDPILYSDYDSEYGHCIFFNTEIYKKNGAENESFISYGPEDKERGERFKKMGFKVTWMPESMIYHFEHFRGSDSSSNNSMFRKNWDVYNECSSMNSDQLIQYYKNQEYNKKYKTIGPGLNRKLTT